MLDEHHRPEAAEPQDTYCVEVLELDLPETVLGRARGLRFGLPVLAHLVERLEGAQQHVEGVAIQHEGLGMARLHLDRRSTGLVLQQGALAKELGLPLLRGQLRHLLAAVQDGDLALDEDVERVPLLALVEDLLAVAEDPLVQGLGKRLFLCRFEGLEELDFVQVSYVCLGTVLGGFRDDGLELFATYDPDGAVGPRLHGGGARRRVEKRELPETVAFAEVAHASRYRLLRAAPQRRVDKHLEATGLHDVEVFAPHVALPDEHGVLRHLLGPCGVDQLADPCVVQLADHLQVLVFLQGLRDEPPLLGVRHGRGITGPDDAAAVGGAAPADGKAVRELELLVEAKPLEIDPRDPVGVNGRHGGDCRGAGHVAQQCLLAEVVAGLQRRHPLAPDGHARLPVLDHEELVAFLVLLDDGLPGEVLCRVSALR
mmetsp:Transcript_71598/g.202123  ORF Transcript_71598/g.202123 Transcript_71598/m.202123 type:complete len:428 (-) Transcript_71598:252-1535(-)